MIFDHKSAILLHPTSLPGPYGIGDLGPAAHRWLDFLKDSGIAWWQVLPLGPTGYGDSPYQSFSAFAGNAMLVSPALLQEEGLLSADDLRDAPSSPSEQVDFAAVNAWKAGLLRQAFQNRSALPELERKFNRFRQEQAGWLEDYALFRAIKADQGGLAWTDWPAPLRDREREAIQVARGNLVAEIALYAFRQFLFFRQWAALRNRMETLGIHIIGDIPIYVAHDSVDVWANRRLFQLDERGQPTHVAGVPPDYFSETGQLWGNPLYRWDLHAEQGFSWWLARFRAVFNMVDVVRLDHFRGFAGYWSVPCGEETAVNGEWLPGPGSDFLQAVKDEFGQLPLIAEDLGEITPDVIELRDQFDLPGMKIFQFGFDKDMQHEFLPHNYPENCVAYTGTHDNDTTLGWLRSAPEAEREFALDYLDSNSEDFVWAMLRRLWASPASLVAAPLQDFLELGSDARMNYPSKPEGNWDWRINRAALSPELLTRITDLNKKFDRNV